MILCAGEALIDMLPRQTKAGESAFAPYVGGAVYNTAIALGRLGAKTGFYSGISHDFFGDMLIDALKQSRVDSRLAHRSPLPTTLAFVRLTDGHAEYAFYDENTAGRMLQREDLPTLPDDVAALFFGGISLVAEPCGSTYEALMVRESGRRATMIDPNIRPSFIADEIAYRGRIDRMLAMADIVKLSDEDLEWLLGPGSIPDRAGAILAKGPKLVFITEGAKGARGYTVDHEVTFKADPVKVVDTVGAGDTFNAGVLAALQRGGVLTKERISHVPHAAIEAALSLAIRAAAVTVSRAGADPPWAKEI